MKQIQNFDSFKDEYMSNRLDENKFTDFISNIWEKIADTYNKLKEKYGINAWLKYNQKIKNDDLLPKGVEIFSPSGSIDENVTFDESEFDNIKIEFFGEAMAHKSDNMSNGGVQDLKDAVEMAYDYRCIKAKKNEGKPDNEKEHKLNSLFVWGAPGIGKTQIIKQIAKKLDLEMIVFHLSQIDPTDFRGLPIIVETEVTDEKMEDAKKMMKRSSNALPLLFPVSNGDNGKGGILFFDELNLAHQTILAAAMPIIDDGTYQGYELPSKWIIVSAGNRKEDVIKPSSLTQISGPLGNRFAHMNFELTIKDWTEWAKNEPAMDPRLVGFLNFDSDGWFHKPDVFGEGTKNMTEGWPSPRTWAEASEMTYELGGDTFDMPLHKMRKIYERSVGVMATNQFYNYLDLIKIISEKQIANIYKTGKGPKLPDRLDTQNAVISAIVFYHADSKMTLKEFTNILKYIETLKNFEIITPALSMLKKATQDKDGNSYVKEGEYRETFMKFAKNWSKLYKEIQQGKHDAVIDTFLKDE